MEVRTQAFKGGVTFQEHPKPDCALELEAVGLWTAVTEGRLKKRAIVLDQATRGGDQPACSPLFTCNSEFRVASVAIQRDVAWKRVIRV